MLICGHEGPTFTREGLEFCYRCELEAKDARIAALEMELSMWKAALMDAVEQVKRAAGNLKAMENQARDRLRVAEGKSE